MAETHHLICIYTLYINVSLDDHIMIHHLVDDKDKGLKPFFFCDKYFLFSFILEKLVYRKKKEVFFLKGHFDK